MGRRGGLQVGGDCLGFGDPVPSSSNPVHCKDTKLLFIFVRMPDRLFVKGSKK